MKKSVLLAVVIATVALFVNNVASAQAPVGDTVRHIPPTYLANQWMVWDEAQDAYSTAMRFFQYHFPPHTDIIDTMNSINPYIGNYIIGHQMFTDHPIKIVGLAACGYMQRTGDTTISFFMNLYSSRNAREQNREIFFPNVRDQSVANRITDSLILYKPVPGDETGLSMLAAAPWRVEQPHSNIVLPTLMTRDIYISYTGMSGLAIFDRYTDPAYPEWPDTTPVVPLYEAYFEKPVVAEDSFVVAGTARNNDGSVGWASVPASYGELRERMWLWDHNPTCYWYLVTFGYDTLGDPYHDCTKEWFKYRHYPWKSTRISSLLGSRHRARKPVLIYPIVDLNFDTMIEHCQQVVGVRVAESTDSTATLMWDAVNSVRWEVKYGMVGMDEGSYRVVTTGSPTVTLTGLRPEVQYKAYVRGWCPCDSSWGAWSDPKTFRVEPSQPTGIDQPSDLDRYTHLFPNPAHGKVSVVSSLRLERVVIYDLDGRRVAEQEATGISAVVDISHLASGTYIAALHTPNGIATKKLVVQ